MNLFLARSRPDRVALLVLLGGWLATAAITGLLASTAGQRDRNAFEAAARQAQAAVLARVETSVALLRGVAGLFASQDREVSVQAFHDYVDRLALREQYPGLLALAFSRRVPPGAEPALAAAMARQGRPGFRIWPAPRVQERHAIVLIEPLDDRNRAALGFDMSTSDVRRAAMEQARDTGAAAASAVVELVQEIEAVKQPGFLIYLPVYEGGEVPATVDARRERLRGFVYAPIRSVDYLSAVFAGQGAPAVGLSVYHGETGGLWTRLYEHGPDGQSTRDELRLTSEVLGQPWTFVFRSTVSRAESLAMPVLVASAGALLSLLLAWLVGRERQARAEAHRALDAERAARADAERANRMKDEFLATLSHELRTPLNAIIGWAALLRRPELSEEQRRNGIDVVDRNARTQARLIEDLLDMNRIVAGKLSLELRRVDFAGVLSDALESLAPTAQARSIALRAEVQPGPVTVRADPARLMQVVWNIVSNAIKFTPPGGRVDVALARVEGIARLSVADNGQGIEPHMLERIFDRFAQADAGTTRRHGGLGLGLAIVRQLVELHGGRVRAKSEGLGRGSTFHVEIPLAPLGEEAAAPPEAPLRGVRVLAVDDDPDSLELARATLASRGAEVVAVASAREAIAQVEKSPPDVLVSDIGMAEMDGYSLVRAVRALPGRKGARIPAVAVTAYTRQEDRQAALSAGFDAHLAKPVTAEALAAAVTALAGRAPR